MDMENGCKSKLFFPLIWFTTPFGDSAVKWALPIPLFGLMGDCFIYLFNEWQ